jgi:hypothetical protein
VLNLKEEWCVFVGDNTIIDVQLTRAQEAKVVFEFVEKGEILIFCINKNDLNSFEEEGINNLLNTRICHESNFDYRNNETDSTNYFSWILLSTIEDLKRIIEMDFFLYHCIVLKEGNNLNEYKYLITMQDSFEHNRSYYRAITVNTLNPTRLTDKLEEIVRNSRRSDI